MTARQIDANGYITIENNPISRAGVFEYLGKEIPGAEDPNKIYKVARLPEELESADTLDSFRNIPLVDDHTWLGRRGTPAEKKGIHGISGASVTFDGKVLRSNIKIFSDTLASLIEKGKTALSLGYSCVFEKVAGTFDGQSYDYVQRKMRGNHIALVDEARCDVEVLDHQIVFDHFDLSLTTKEKDMAVDPNAAPNNPAGEEKPALTLESVAAKVDALAAAVEKLAKDEEPEAVPGAATGDEDPEKKPEEGKAADSDEKVAELEKKSEAMDAKIKGLTKALEGGEKAILETIAKKDKLHAQASQFIGTFDHSTKTLSETQQYVAEKLGFKDLPPETVGYALDGYFAAAGTRSKPSVAMDGKAKSSEIDAYLKNEKA